MFGWLRKLRSRRATRTQRTVLNLESLEGRDCPAAPTLSLNLTDLGGHMIALDGSVADENPATAVVLITTPNQSTDVIPVNSDGTFVVPDPYLALGEFSLRACDDESLYSEITTLVFSIDAPQLTITDITHGAGQFITVSGYVTADCPAGLVVTLSGVVDGTTTTAGDGTFSFTALADGPGTILADTSDAWDQDAAQAYAFLSNAAPVVEDFTAVPVDEDTYEFRGHVNDEYAPGLTVTLAGLPAFGTNGVEVSVDASGNFSYQIDVTEQDSGTVSAHVSDAWGAAAQEASLPFQISETGNPDIAVTSIIQGANRSVTVTGTLSGENVSGVTVTLSGVLSGSTTTDSSGNFTFTGTASAAGAFQVAASGAQVSAMLTNAVPTINGLRVVEIVRGQTYEIRGTVVDEWSPGLTVHVAGLPSLGEEGRNLTVNSACQFVHQFNVQRDENGVILDVGLITATLSDWFGAAAQEQSFYFTP